MHNLLIKNKLSSLQVRCISKYLNRDKTAKAVRQRFIDYFINEQNHTFVRSSPVVPYCDPTVAFVNAGMNQFKGIFLGIQAPVHKRVTNTQKCIRVGGKHNDLNYIGKDGHHHTFFEMLGSWSFGDYFKKEACEMAWKLLTDVYNIEKSSMYVTYFGGDESIGIGPDWECRDIWRSLGIPEDRILPFGTADNFWEMGMTGPCGPCTEIHIDQRGSTNRSQFVNKGLHDLTEIWNVVFIQYNRTKNGAVEMLPSRHVDTGMGFERLCALLQGKTSNYDTDVFTPLFSAINKICKGLPKYGGRFGEDDWNDIDTSYRVLADHCRMATVCLADGMIPEQNQKLRRILRKTFTLSEGVFKKERGLTKELSNYVAEFLGEVYTEMEKNIKQVQQIIDYEEELFKSLRIEVTSEWRKLTLSEDRLLQELDVTETPGLVNAYREIIKNKIGEISPKLAVKLYDTYGLDEHVIANLANALKLPFDCNKFHDELKAYKLRSMVGNVDDNGKLSEQVSKLLLRPTDDSFKYTYERRADGGYGFENVDAKVLFAIKGDELVVSLEPGADYQVVFDKTNLYQESGGQSSDMARAVFDDGSLDISDVQKVNGVLLHKVRLMSSRNLAVGASVKLEIDHERRLGNMRNHTGLHLLNATLKKYKGATCQKSSKVTNRHLRLDVGIFGDKLTVDDLKIIENDINGAIEEGVDVRIDKINSQELLGIDNITLIPGEVYPEDGIRLVEIITRNLQSKEPCCGTHIQNTADLLDFCIVSCRSLGRSTTSLHAVTGRRAKVCREKGVEILERIAKLKRNVEDNIDKPEVLERAVSSLKKQLNYDIDDEHILPITVRHKCMENLDNISKQIKSTGKVALRKFVEMEMKNVMETKILRTRNDKEYIVHYLRSSMMLESVPLQKATKVCTSCPILVVSYSGNVVKARCCVPKKDVTPKFDAEKWMNKVCGIFGSAVLVSKGQDSKLVCNMKPTLVNIQDWDVLLKESLENAKIFAEKCL